MQGWNIADVLEAVGAVAPEQPALITADREVTWGRLLDDGRRFARHLVDAGVGRQGKVALYLKNRPEYIGGFVGSLQGSFVPVNTNYRYAADELAYLWDNCDAEAVVFQGSFVDVVESVRDRVPSVRTWIWVDDGTASCPPWATSYVEAVATRDGSQDLPWRRSGDDLVLLYTGGTTGMPKGVMWRQDDLFNILSRATGSNYPADQDLQLVRDRVPSSRRRHLPAAPLMHGTGTFTCLPFLFRGGAVVLLQGDSFSADELLDAVDRHDVYSVAWVGDVFARPVVEELERGGAWDLTGWKVVTSGGLTFSDDLKSRLIARVPHLTIADVFGASETLAVGRSITRGGSGGDADRSFSFESGARVFRHDSTQDVRADGAEIGRVAFAGRHPLGYYKDEAKTASTFLRVDGTSYCLSGDFATLNPDGTVNVLGRGSTSINTGGEKVFPEEVETVIRQIPGVVDVAVAGTPDERWGEAVSAAVEVEQGCTLEPDVIQSFVRERLAAYKIPRRVVFVDEVPRVPSGKPDYDLLGPLIESLSVG
ncbi:AMP-binding protein [Nocardioides sp.]|uniref:AMP-binding protein n=1 Tax=Nocardioides sp. TaxID=35761 RepID=UPI00260DBD9C|nr:AMP-binding protein [Nocardioides sp.]MCW2737959.1 fatty-acid--CoA ligase [Nocardioides sp.]